MAEARRTILVPDREWLGATLVRAANESTGDRSEAGRSVGPATDTETATVPAGSIRPTLSGAPEEHVAGQLAVTQAGVVDNSRFGFVRDGDDEDTDLQVRQSPMVVGRRPDILSRQTPSASSFPYHTHPKLLSLVSGDCLLVYLRAERARIFSRNGYSSAVLLQKLDADSDSWGSASEIIETPGVASSFSAPVAVADYIVAVDICQFPDTGEIMMVLATQDAFTDATVTERRIYVLHSVDDGGTWSERSVTFIGTSTGGGSSIGDVEFNDGTLDDDAPIVSVAVERLDSDRLVLLVHTETGTWTLTSDDRGKAWSVGGVLDDQSAKTRPGGSVDLARMRNGALVAVLSSDSLSGEVAFSVSLNGVTWVTDVAGGVNTAVEVVNGLLPSGLAVVMRPDGWPTIYGTQHAPYRDWLWSLEASTRDPDLTADIDTFNGELGGATPHHGFHIIEGQGSYTATTPPELFYGGFVEVAACLHRGHVILATTFCRQDTGSTATNPDLDEDSLVVYRLNHWQPLQERLSDVGAGPYPSAPADGRVYNRTWDAYSEPDNVGFTATGAPGASLVAGGAEDGYLVIDTTAAQGYYEDTSLPNATSGRDGVVRAIVRSVDHGSETSDDLVIWLRLVESGQGYGIKVRIEDDGSNQKIAVYDEASGNPIGSTVSVAMDQWLEVVFGMYSSGSGTLGVCFVRAHDPSVDPDFDAPYTAVVDGGSITSVGTTSTEFIRFGHYTSSTGVSWWKGVHLHRAGTLPTDGPLGQLGVTYKDTETDNNLAAEGGTSWRQDAGIVNHLRTSQATWEPPQWLTRGARVRWSGEAVTEGQFDYASRYTFGGGNVPQVPALREWRSDGQSASNALELVFQAPSGSPGFRISGMAMFGRNFPACDIEFNATDSWSTPAYTATFGIPAIAGDRYTHIFGLDPSGSWGYATSGHRVRIDAPGSIEPFIPHQFASVDGGPRYYLAVTKGSTTTVYRIRDNTGTALVLETEVTGADFGSDTSTLAIYSDRFAVEAASPFAASTIDGYEFCRLRIYPVTFRDSDEGFYRLGHMLLGQALILHPQWGFSQGMEPGVEITYQPAGGSVVRRRAAPRRKLRLDQATMRPPQVASDVEGSPATAQPTRTWARWIAALSKLEVGRHPVAVVFGEGDRALFADGTDAATQVATDPGGLMLARVTVAGDVEHQAYQCRSMNLGAGATDVPRIIAAVRGVEFTEEF